MKNPTITQLQETIDELQINNGQLHERVRELENENSRINAVFKLLYHKNKELEDKIEDVKIHLK